MKIIKLGSININDFNVKTGPKNSAMYEICPSVEMGDNCRGVGPLGTCPGKWGFLNGCYCF